MEIPDLRIKDKSELKGILYTINRDWDIIKFHVDELDDVGLELLFFMQPIWRTLEDAEIEVKYIKDFILNNPNMNKNINEMSSHKL